MWASVSTFLRNSRLFLYSWISFPSGQSRMAACRSISHFPGCLTSLPPPSSSRADSLSFRALRTTSRASSALWGRSASTSRPMGTCRRPKLLVRRRVEALALASTCRLPAERRRDSSLTDRVSCGSWPEMSMESMAKRAWTFSSRSSSRRPSSSSRRMENRAWRVSTGSVNTTMGLSERPIRSIWMGGSGLEVVSLGSEFRGRISQLAAVESK